MAERIAQLYVELSARTDKLEAALKSSHTGLSKFKGGLNEVVKGLTGFDLATVGTAAAIGAVAAGLKYAIGQAAEAEAVMAQTEAVIKSTGGAAGVTADEVAAMAESLSQVSTFSDDAVQKGQNLLLTFTNIGQETFPAATQAMVDMATAMGTDVSSGAIQLGKALNNPVQGISALTRVGVTFTQEQKDVIKSLVETGKVAEAQAIILEELSREFGGSAAAAADTYAGQLAVLRNNVDNLAEEIGGALLPSLTKATSALNLLLTWNDKVRAAVITHGQAVELSAEGYAAYTVELERAAAAAGLSVNAQGDLVQIERNRFGVLERVVQANYMLTQAEYDQAQAAREAAAATDAHTAAMLAGETAFQRGGAAIDYAALAEDKYAREVAAAQAAEEEAQRAAEIHAEHLRDIDRAARDATIAHQDLAISLKDASAAELAGVALENLKKSYEAGEITASEYRKASTDLMLTFGLATPASLAMATATDHLNTLFATGQITAGQLTAAMGLLPKAAEDGKVSMDELGIKLNDHTTPEMWEARDAAAELRDTVGSLSDKTITVTTHFVENHITTGSGQFFGQGGQASGGPTNLFGMGPRWVGEQGPEIWVPPQPGGYILTAQDAKAAVQGAAGAGAGGDVTIYVDARGALEPAAVEAAGYRGAQRALAEAGVKADSYRRMGGR